jgi:hypothetical protein
MLCITVRQPWAWAIFHGKDIENRDWPTRVRGRVAIHAAKGMTEREYRAAYAYCAERGVILPMPTLLFRGCVLGTVEVINCVSSSDSPWFMGDYGFVLKDARLFPKPVVARGQLGFWNWEGK